MHILIAGDFVPTRRTEVQINNGDYSCLDEVKPILRTVDYSIVNFESPVVSHAASPIIKTGPNLKCSERAVECLAQAGFKCVTLANNHFRDYGQIGVEDTLMACQKYGIDSVGGGKDIEEARQLLYKDICGQKLAVINLCENEWSIANYNYGGSNPLNPIENYYSILEARKNSDYVLVVVHGGIEHYQLPTPRMVETYRFFIDAGADAVVNHHQHCYSGYEVYKGKPIFYGLGNFCFDKLTENNNQKSLGKQTWEEGFMIDLCFEKTVSFQLYPYIQCTETYPMVRILNDKESFKNSLFEINAIILDREQLRQHFEERVVNGLNNLNDLLIPYTSNFMRALAFKNIIPSFVTSKRIKKMLANIQCESHCDVLIWGLKTMLFSKSIICNEK